MNCATLLRRAIAGLATFLLAATAVHAASLSVTNVTAPATARPGDTVTFSVVVTNSSTLDGDDAPSSMADVTIDLLHSVYGDIALGTAPSVPIPVVPAGGSVQVKVQRTIPLSYPPAAPYNIRATLTNLSGPGALLFTVTQVATQEPGITIIGGPDFVVTDLRYKPAAYVGGDTMPMSLSFHNRIRTNGITNTAYVPGLTNPSGYFRIEVVLSVNPVFGDDDDFLLTFFDIDYRINADDAPHTLRWTQVMPGNYPGTFFVFAKIDALDQITTEVEGDFNYGYGTKLRYIGNVVYDETAEKVTLLPTNFAAVTRASEGTGGIQGNGSSHRPSLSYDGNYVAFYSDASNLVDGDTNALADVFVKDMLRGRLDRISLSRAGVQANGASINPSMSGNARWVAYESLASNVTDGDTNAVADIFVWGLDSSTGQALVSRESVTTSGAQANLTSSLPRLSFDGRWLVFQSQASNLDGTTTAGRKHIYLRDRTSGTTTRIDRAPGGVEPNGDSVNPAISIQRDEADELAQLAGPDDGRFVVFASDANNLVSGDTNYMRDIFIYDRANAGAGVVRLSLASNDTTQANGPSDFPAVAFIDGQVHVVFQSTASNLVAGDTNGVSDVFLAIFDPVSRARISLQRISRTDLGDQARDPANEVNKQGSTTPTISADARFVSYASLSANLSRGDSVGHQTADLDVVLDRDGDGIIDLPDFDNDGALDLWDLDGDGIADAIDSDGDGAPDSFDFNHDGFLDRLTIRELFSVFDRDRNGLLDELPDFNGDSTPDVVPVPVDINGDGTIDYYIWKLDLNYDGLPDGHLGAGIGDALPNTASPAIYPAYLDLDHDGLVDSLDGNSAQDIYLLDRLPGHQTGTPIDPADFDQATSLERVSVNRFGYQTSRLFSPSSPSSLQPNVSGDGRFLAFASDSENTAGLVHGFTNRTSPDTNNRRDVFLHDRRTDATPGPGLNTAPSVAITAPADLSTITVKTVADIAVAATDPDPTGYVASVDFYVNGKLHSTVTSSPFKVSYAFNTTGTFTLYAVARDDIGAVTTSEPVTVKVEPDQPPTVSILEPATAASFSLGSSVTVRATAADAEGALASVQFFVGGTSLGAPLGAAPFLAAWNPTSTGTFQITAVATDAAGNVTTSTPVTVTIAPSPAPVVALTNPAAATSITVGNSLNLVASASSTGGSIQSVSFYAGTTLIGSPDATAPYQVTWTPTLPGTYQIKAVATDNVSQSTSSATIEVTVLANPAPVVSLTQPAAAFSTTTGSPVALGATAADPQGSVVKVEFLSNGTVVATDAAAPYEGSWTPATPGTYSVTARATDDSGNVTTSAAIMVTVAANASPEVVLVSPRAANSLPVGATYTLTAAAGDSDGTIQRVEFFVAGLSIGADTSFPYEATWAPAALGSYTLYAVATDNNGASTTSAALTVNVISGSFAPAVALLSPADGDTLSVGSPVTLAASAGEPATAVASVRFYVANTAAATAGTLLATDTVYPFSASWTPGAPGNYFLFAEVTDTTGLVATSPINVVRVQSGAVPAVALTAPAAGQYRNNSALALTATASDADGTIAKVEFIVDGAVVGTDATASYSAAWLPAAPGVYLLSARATDNSGAVTTTPPTRVTIIDDEEPVAVVTSPADGDTITVGITTEITADAYDVDGVIASVEFFVNGQSFGTDTTPPYSASFTPISAGYYVIEAVATDDGGNITSSAPVTVQAPENAPPTAILTSPVSGANGFAGVSVQLAATAGDIDGSVASVSFVVNGATVATDTSAPYSASWTPPSAGLYRITAVVTDNADAVTTSAITYLMVIDDATPRDLAYFGSYIGGSEAGRMAAVRLATGEGIFIGHTNVGAATPRIYFHQGFSVSASGGFGPVDGLAGTFSPTSASGTLDNSRLTYVGALAAGGGANVPAGLYQGHLSSDMTSTVLVVVGENNYLTLYAARGAATDAASGVFGLDGTFSLTTARGGTVTGKVDLATGSLRATFTNSPVTGEAVAALGTISRVSDGTLRNLSTRGRVGTGDKVLIAGFIVGGEQPKRYLLRAIGPSLPDWLPGRLGDPHLRLFRYVPAVGETPATSVEIATNDNWGSAGDSAAIVAASSKAGAGTLTSGSKDAILLLTLEPGIYTAHVSGVGGTSGVALVEIFEVDSPTPFSDEKALNVSTRGDVGTGDDVLIAGLVVGGTSPKQVLIRAVGPTLADYEVPGALADPVIRLTKTDGTVLRENDNWGTGNMPAYLEKISARVGASELKRGSKDAAMLVTLPPGNYTAIVSGAGGQTGIALVEVFEVQ